MDTEYLDPKTNLPRRTTSGKRQRSVLVDETYSMDRKRRLLEQEGHRRIARVNAREHPEEEVRASGPEGEYQNGIMQHPELENQRYDGVDNALNPKPDLNTEARTKFDNEQREQEKEKQLRMQKQLGLDNAPKFGTAPTPRMGG